MTSTVIYGTNFTALSTTTSSPSIASITLPSNQISTATTSSILSTATVSITGHFIIAVNSPVTRRAKRAAQAYIGFSGNNGILVDSQQLAAQFSLFNNILSYTNEFVGASSSVGSSQFQLFFSSQPPAVSGPWTYNGAILNLGAAQFCVDDTETVYIVLSGNGPPTCSTILLSPIIGMRP